MHDVLARVVAQEAAKLDELSRAQPTALLCEEHLKALEMLARCAKSLRVDPDAPEKEKEPTTEEALAEVEGT